MEQFDYKCGEKEIGDRTEPLLSIIMPVYNTEKYLGQAIESVLHQSFKDLELIIVEDKSEDGSFALCKTYAQTDARINLLKGEHRGVSEARNKGILEAKGRYITFIDSDDFIHPNTYEIIFTHLQSNKDTIYAFGLVNYYTDNTDIEFMAKEKLTESYKINDRIIFCNSFKDCICQMLTPDIGFFLCNKVYPASAVKKLLIDTEYSMCEDLIFNWMIAKERMDMIVIDMPLYYYRHTNSSITRTPNLNMYKDCVKAYKYIIDTDSSGISEESYREFIKRYIHFNLILIEIMCLDDSFDLKLYRNIISILKLYKSIIKQETAFKRVKIFSAVCSYRLFKVFFSIEKSLRSLMKKRSWYIEN